MSPFVWGLLAGIFTMVTLFAGMILGYALRDSKKES